MNTDKPRKDDNTLVTETAKREELVKKILGDYALDILLEYFSIIDLEFGGDDNNCKYLDMKLRVSEKEIQSKIPESQEELKHVIKLIVAGFDPGKILKHHL